MINMIPSIQGVNFNPKIRKLLQAPFGICIILYTYIYGKKGRKRRKEGRRGIEKMGGVRSKKERGEEGRE
jgi:hypothetical protein